MHTDFIDLHREIKRISEDMKFVLDTLTTFSAQKAAKEKLMEDQAEKLSEERRKRDHEEEKEKEEQQQQREEKEEQEEKEQPKEKDGK